MYRETIVHNGKRYHRYPESPRRHLRVYFWRHSNGGECPFALHRQIWIDNNGEIPKGFIIHHKDGNSLNNKIENLEMLQKNEHSKNHMLTPERREMSRQNAKKQGNRLNKDYIKWTKTKEGKEHCKKNVVGSIFLKTPKKHICPICNYEFESIYIVAKYCSKKCKNYYNNHLSPKKKKSI